MALKGKCSIDGVDGQMSAPIEGTTFTHWRKGKPLRLFFFFFGNISKVMLTYARASGWILGT